MIYKEMRIKEREDKRGPFVAISITGTPRTTGSCGNWEGRSGGGKGTCGETKKVRHELPFFISGSDASDDV